MTNPGDQLPDGWIQTPLPPDRREDGPDGRDRSWFARNGEPVTLDQPIPKQRVPEPLQLTRVVLVAATIFTLVAGGFILWSL